MMLRDKPVPPGVVGVLTLFDYLRQRAYESVMAGAQEALEALERHNGDAPSGAPHPKLPLPASEERASGVTTQKAGGEAPPPDGSADDLLPPPRRRPRAKSGKGKP